MSNNLNLTNFIYMEEYKFVFAYVPKVACTAWKGLLRSLMGVENAFSDGKVHDYDESGLLYLHSLSDANAIISNPDIKKYAFVRCPYTRVLSAYLNKIDAYNPQNVEPGLEEFWGELRIQIANEVLGAGHPDRDVTLSIFLEWLATSKNKYIYDHHWRPQSEIIYPRHIAYDFIGRFENLHGDAQFLFNELGLDVGLPSHKQTNFPATNASSLIDQYFTPSDFAIVNELFKSDFENFNYEKRIL